MIDETPVHLDQIEIWQHALEEGRSLLAEAAQLQAAAKQAQLVRHWNEAAEKFRRARSTYETAQGCLMISAGIDAGAYRALRMLREEAERTMRAASERAGEKSGLVSKIVMVLLVAVLLGLIIGVGPQLWLWVAG